MEEVAPMASSSIDGSSQRGRVVLARQSEARVSSQSDLAVKSIKANCLQLLTEFFLINKILPLKITE